MSDGSGSVDDARVLGDRAATSVADAVEAVVECYRARVWRELGYRSWRDYCAVELATAMRARLSPAQRDDLVDLLAEGGLPAPGLVD